MRISTRTPRYFAAAMTTALWIGAAGVAALTPCHRVSAQEPSASERALARSAFRQGMSAARAERWEDARVAFERAWGLVHRPRVLLNLATAQVHSGRLVEGAENYRRYLREAGPDADERVSSQARHRLAQLERRTPQLTVLAPGIRADDALTLDGSPLSRAALSAPLPVNPGAHEVRVLRDGLSVARGEVTLRERSHETLRLEVPAPAPPTQVPASTQVPDPAEAAQQASEMPDDAGQGDVLSGPDEPPTDSEGGVLRSPWLWIAVGLAVGGGVTAGVLLTRDTGQGPFRGNIGPGFWEVQ